MRVARSPMRTSVLALALVAMQALTSEASSSSSPPIQASIRTSWAAPPLLLEILETVAVENKTAYFPLMRQLTETQFLAGIDSDKDLYQKSLDLIQEQGHVQPDALSTLKLSMAMHTAAPWIQAHYHLYSSTVVPHRTSKADFNPDCGVWVDWYDQQICSVSELEALVAAGLDRFSKKSKNKPATTELDHVSPSKTESDLFTILYADVYDSQFAAFRSYLDSLSKSHGLQYSIRYRPSTSSEKAPTLALAGFGVELALKSTDYIVIDDRDLGHGEDQGATQQTVFGQGSGKDLFGDEVPAVEPVSQQDLGGLGLATAQFILQSDDPLKTLVSVSQDFPKYQRKLSKLEPEQTLRAAVQRNSMFLRENRIWLNNQPIPHHKMNPFNLIRLLRRERESIASLATLGMSNKKAIDLLTDIGTVESSDGGNEPVGMFDVRDKSEGKNLVVWLNDLESDKRYADWDSRLEALRRPTYGGQFHQIRKNVVNTLFVLDFSQSQSMEVIAFELTNYVQRLIPFRFGLLPLVKSDSGNDATIAILWRHVVSRHGIKGGLEFLKAALVNQVQAGNDFSTAVRKSFAASMQLAKLKNTETPELTYDEVLIDPTYRVWLQSVKAMADRVGVTSPSLFINGKYFAWNQDHGRVLTDEAPQQMAFLTERYAAGVIGDETNIYEYFQTLPYVFERRNPYLFVSDEAPLKIVDLVQRQQRPLVDTLSYVSKEGSNSPTTTVIVVADFGSKQGVETAIGALESLETTDFVRVAFVQNGLELQESTASLENFIRQSSVDGKALPLGFWKELFQGVAKGTSFVESFQKASSHYPEIAVIGMEGSKGTDEANKRSVHQFLRETLKAKPTDLLIVVNGRVVGPIPEAMTSNDFKMLYSYELGARVDKIVRLLKGSNVEATPSNILKASSVVLMATQQLDQGLYDINDPVISRDRSFEALEDEHTGFTVNPSAHAGDDNTLYYFTAALDPAHQLTQKWAAILETLSKLDNVKVKVVLQPSMRLSEAPIKRFYRYAADAELNFDAEGAIVSPSAYFAGLPEPSLLTLGVDVNPAWVVTSKVCIHDLDNLKLSSLTGAARTTGVQAEFELQHILVEGFARDITQKVPPKGAQFILGTKAEPHVADTLVMANMGYFQLKANPGVWEMVLRPGRTQQVFSIESIGSEGWVSGGVKNDKRDVIIANFEGLVLYPRLVRNEGMERANVQDEVAQPESGLWDSIKSTASSIKGFTSNGNNKAVEKKKAEINIFSVASGHLYERFLSIMILSVIKNTESRVKFWFIENFLSPSFKDYIPHMAEEYDFDYELVTYNWPHWLRAQTEKQRIIWAYKILFLDVLFPLDLDKVIFVDADQIVRTDMKELVDLDLQGAPYGYTPMCQDRAEMEGFRFWNQGYWRDHLRGKPYHISALYVIDLVRFRQMQAGDRLRNHYQQLSADPGSLANLDQDLPNNMQNEVPIFSLPQEWLWCETWCGDKGLENAKTIDLCNNPLTKEPKLDRARRQIKEWESLDNEATDFAKKVNAERRQQQQQESKKTAEQTETHIKDEL